MIASEVSKQSENISIFFFKDAEKNVCYCCLM